MPNSMEQIPPYDALSATESCPAGTSWNVFTNELGTLNFLSPEALVKAAAEVRRGVVFSLNLDTTMPDPPILGRGKLRHNRIALPGGGFDDFYDQYYPQASSQWDALCHVEHPEYGFYKAHNVNAITDPLNPKLGIEQWAARGIAGRFVLADVAGHLESLGTPIDASSSFAISVELLEEVLLAQGSQLHSGDILLINTGWITWYRTLDPDSRLKLATSGLFPAPGLDPSEDSARWLWDNQLAAVAADCPALERMPFDLTREEGFLHFRLIPKLGFAIGELFDLESLVADCRRDRRYQGLFCAAPVNTPGGAGSPANALALK